MRQGALTPVLSPVPRSRPCSASRPRNGGGDNTLRVKQLRHQDGERVLAIFDRWHQAAEPFSVEYRYLGRDGRVV